ncbi:MAG: hypothetical protein HOI07_12275 [Betaproteobacteria bacterium]|jgi:hypothetical protein|nr:hypothetical protein [Betaproteobacteria bacterium]
MIGYSPIDFGDEPSPSLPRKGDDGGASKKKQQAPAIMEDTTECNYVVMFFIVGVIALAAMDSVKK